MKDRGKGCVGHIFTRVYEESILGIGRFPVGYQCDLCGFWVSEGDARPGTFPGVDSGRSRTIGVQGSSPRGSWESD